MAQSASLGTTASGETAGGACHLPTALLWGI
jgi:hypothetical protein